MKTLEELQEKQIDQLKDKLDIFMRSNKSFLETINNLRKEIARLNKIIDELEKIFDTPYFDEEVSKQLGSDGFFTFKQMYEACSIVFKKRLQELKEEGK